jgi:monovalent cation/hydrogen antiporter
LAVGGIAVGLVIGVVAYWLHKYFSLDAGIEIVLTFVTAYAAYIIAERLHCSGVLSVVTAGLFIGSKQATLHKANMRIKAVAVWEFVNVVLNGLIFILIGLQLPIVVGHIENYSLLQLCGYGVIISVAVVAIRFGFIFLVDALSNSIRKKLQKPTVFPSKKHTTVLAFTAMRGIVSLAAVFSIPLLLNNGAAFPQRDSIIFITFIVILFTLVLQGLCLPMLIKFLNFDSHENNPSHIKNAIKKELAMAAVHQLQTYITANNINDAVATSILNWHLHEANLQTNNNNLTTQNKQLRKTLLLESIVAKRNALLQLHHQHAVDTELYHELLHGLDLEEARLQ